MNNIYIACCHRYVFLVEVIIGNLARMDHVCAYEIERISHSQRQNSLSPTSQQHPQLSTSINSNSLSSTSINHSQHKLVLYSLTRDQCDRVYDLLRHDIHVSSIKFDKDDRRCLTNDSWHAYVRRLYAGEGDGFRRRRVLLNVKQNQLTLVGFEHDVNAMRKRIYDYFVENAISFYESD
jgi:hypothetical protein